VASVRRDGNLAGKIERKPRWEEVQGREKNTEKTLRKGTVDREKIRGGAGKWSAGNQPHENNRDAKEVGGNEKRGAGESAKIVTAPKGCGREERALIFSDIKRPENLFQEGGRTKIREKTTG